MVRIDGAWRIVHRDDAVDVEPGIEQLACAWCSAPRVLAAVRLSRGPTPA